MNITKISFDDVNPIWSKYLWPERVSKIEPYSAIVYGHYPYKYDAEYVLSVVDFFGIYDNNILIGVNSGHPTGSSYRSRGLYISNEFRGKGLGILLLQETINCARQLGYSLIWSMPRQDSISTYNNAGFIQSSSWFGTETSTSNCFVIKDLNSDK